MLRICQTADVETNLHLYIILSIVPTH